MFFFVNKNDMYAKTNKTWHISTYFLSNPQSSFEEFLDGYETELMLLPAYSLQKLRLLVKKGSN